MRNFDIEITDFSSVEIIKGQLIEKSNLTISTKEKYDILETNIRCGIFDLTVYTLGDCSSYPLSIDPYMYLPKITDYKAVEISIDIIEKNEDSIRVEWIYPTNYPAFSKCYWIKYFNNSYDKVIGEEVLIDDLYQIIKDCYDVSELRMFI
jgi:hypothetical protein